jgi:predicted Rossmann-fold nucleotide-binding protein
VQRHRRLARSTREQWVKEERKKKTLLSRLQALIEGCDAAIALPGGPGTLTEITLMWNLMIISRPEETVDTDRARLGFYIRSVIL